MGAESALKSESEEDDIINYKNKVAREREIYVCRQKGKKEPSVGVPVSRLLVLFVVCVSKV